MLQGIFEPVAERKRGALERILRDFPACRFILVGDSGEADLEVYTDIVLAHPRRVIAIYIRNVTTPSAPGFFDLSVGGSDETGENVRPGAATDASSDRGRAAGEEKKSGGADVRRDAMRPVLSQRATIAPGGVNGGLRAHQRAASSTCF
jgi:hypothetical protein